MPTLVSNHEQTKRSHYVVIDPTNGRQLVGLHEGCGFGKFITLRRFEYNGRWFDADGHEWVAETADGLQVWSHCRTCVCTGSRPRA